VITLASVKHCLPNLPALTHFSIPHFILSAPSFLSQTMRIDSNMDLTLDNVESGHQQLLRYYENVMGNRWLVLKIFALLLVFTVGFTVFVA
jgi:hypothetical protein